MVLTNIEERKLKFNGANNFMKRINIPLEEICDVTIVYKKKLKSWPYYVFYSYVPTASDYQLEGNSARIACDTFRDVHFLITGSCYDDFRY